MKSCQKKCLTLRWRTRAEDEKARNHTRPSVKREDLARGKLSDNGGIKGTGITDQLHQECCCLISGALWLNPALSYLSLSPRRLLRHLSPGEVFFFLPFLMAAVSHPSFCLTCSCQVPSRCPPFVGVWLVVRTMNHPVFEWIAGRRIFHDNFQNEAFLNELPVLQLMRREIADGANYRVN